jgi:hypothetical protein
MPDMRPGYAIRGCARWPLRFRHGAEAGQWLETCLVASRGHHLRQWTRQTAEALRMEQAVRAFLQPGSEPRVTYRLAGQGNSRHF